MQSDPNCYTILIHAGATVLDCCLFLTSACCVDVRCSSVFGEQCDFCSFPDCWILASLSSPCIFTYLQNFCLAVRAYHKIKELQRLLEIAYSNYRQLGGITEEERKMKKEERKVKK